MTEAELVALRDEIKAKVSQTLRDSKNTEAIAVAFSAGRVQHRRVPIADLQAYLQTTGVWWEIKAILRTPEHPAFACAEAVVDVAGARYENIDLQLPIVAQMFGGLVAAGVMTAGQMQELQGLSEHDAPVSEYEVRSAAYARDGDWLL